MSQHDETSEEWAAECEDFGCHEPPCAPLPLIEEPMGMWLYIAECACGWTLTTHIKLMAKVELERHCAGEVTPYGSR